MKSFNPDLLLPVLKKAAEAILEHYEKHGEVTLKEDRSPLTEADRVSHRILTEGLREIYPDVPVLSEEGEQFPYNVRSLWEDFFLIDPLDGTKGFLRKDGEFAINIAFIHNHRAVAGLIHEPVTGITYIAQKGAGAYRTGTKNEILPIAGNNYPEIRVILSRDDSSSELQDLLAMIPGGVIHRKSSSLKFCMLAEGSVDFYPRKRPSMEWDTAAGAILVEEAGGMMLEENGVEISYNRANLLNPPFFAFNSAFQQKVANWEEILFGRK